MFYGCHFSITPVKYHLGAINVARRRTHQQVKSMPRRQRFWLPPSSGANPTMGGYFLFVPTLLHAAHGTSVAIPECPHALAIPRIPCNDSEHSHDHGRTAPPPRQARPDRVIVLRIHFSPPRLLSHRAKGTRLLLLARVSDNAGGCQVLFECTNPCTPKSAPFRSIRKSAVSNQGSLSISFRSGTQPDSCISSVHNFDHDC